MLCGVSAPVGSKPPAPGSVKEAVTNRRPCITPPGGALLSFVLYTEERVMAWFKDFVEGTIYYLLLIGGCALRSPS